MRPSNIAFSRSHGLIRGGLRHQVTSEPISMCNHALWEQESGSLTITVAPESGVI
jgi:hypothetical protein